MSSIKHVDYMNKPILFIDLEGSASDFEVVDLGEKAKKLFKLSSRIELYVMYNLTGVVLTKQVMVNMKQLMEYANMVSRRVIFGIDPKYAELVRQVMVNLNVAANTRYVDNYTQAVNLIVDDTEWVNRRGAGAAPKGTAGGRVIGWDGRERRQDPPKVYREDEFIANVNKMNLPKSQ